MTTTRAKWQLHPPVPRSHLASFPDLPSLLVQCLYNRGVIAPHDVRRFLAGECEEGDPFQLKDVAEAVTRIRQAIRGDELIAVYGDFDADGVTGTVLLTETISSLGGRVIPYIPHRVDEGYGLNESALRKLVKQGVSLIVTVDCGARALREVECARGMGADVIVTDHHSLGGQLPAALAIVNTKRMDCNYPFEDLSGVGIAFKLAQALLLVSQQSPLRGERRPVLEEDLLDLVALGTVADLSPLLGENRSLVKRGLALLKHPRRPGILALMEQANAKPETVTAATIGYVLGPRINAAGRVDDAILSYQLLTTSSPSRARELAGLLEEKNQQRREMMLATVEAARLQVLDQEDEPFLFATGDDYHEGVLGLAAQRLCDEFYRPVAVVKSGEEQSVSSVRSVDEFDIAAALDECAPLLKRRGGHAKAAGFTVSNENLPVLRRRLRQIAAERMAGVELVPTLHIDADMPLSSLTPQTFATCQQLEPLGAGNPEPLLLSSGVEVRDSRVVGENHLKLALSDGGVVWDGIAFGMAQHAEDLAPRTDIVYTPQVRIWRGEEQLQLRIEDFKPSP
ncbi:MAG: single-stranded-DNA-specific exonuclease RecJ [Chloroflexi bacterium B3_Chlor]|nr:MAG: single-stranded-DNA-specific exonuclease RecJ [Chloroflexi bacterium B3_Chlor]